MTQLASSANWWRTAALCTSFAAEFSGQLVETARRPTTNRHVDLKSTLPNQPSAPVGFHNMVPRIPKWDRLLLYQVSTKSRIWTVELLAQFLLPELKRYSSEIAC
jgi:hypothetical protein